MNPTEKLLADLEYWRNEQRDAEERLRVANEVLPGLEQTVERLTKDRPDFIQQADRGSESPERQADSPAPPRAPAGTAESEVVPAPHQKDEHRLSGTAEQQVYQALKIEAPQSSLDLEEFVAERGRSFSPGAIKFAIRDLRKAGKIVEVKKVGNLRFYEPTPPETDQPA